MTKLVPIPGAKPGQLQMKVDERPIRLTRKYISQEISEMAYLSLRKQKGVELFDKFAECDLRGYMQFMQNLILRDADEGVAGLTIVVQQIVSQPTPTKGVGGSPVLGDVQVVVS